MSIRGLIVASALSILGANAAQAADTVSAAPRKASPATDAWSEKDTTATVLERSRKAKDKRAFLDRALAIGGGAHLYVASQVLRKCEKVNEIGRVGAEQHWVARISATDPGYARRVLAFRASIAGCEGFEARPVSRDMYVVVMRRLWDSPDPVAAAMRVRPYATASDTGTSSREHVIDLMETGDPYVMSHLSGLVAARGAGVELWSELRDGDPKVAAVYREHNAWRWALCELGLDCSPASPFGLQACHEAGLCDWSSIDEIAPIRFNAAGAGVSAARKDEIVRAVRAHDWAKLGL